MGAGGRGEGEGGGGGGSVNTDIKLYCNIASVPGLPMPKLHSTFTP